MSFQKVCDRCDQRILNDEHEATFRFVYTKHLLPRGVGEFNLCGKCARIVANFIEYRKAPKGTDIYPANTPLDDPLQK